MQGDRVGVLLEGLLLAGLGFGLSRFAVAESLQLDAALPFLIIGMLPLVIGLALACFGVVLALGTFSRSYAQTVSLWAFAGTATIQLLILLTVVDALVRGEPLGVRLGADLFVANVLLGGAIGGTVLGDRIARTRRSRHQLQRRAEWGTVINRVLRHDVLNAATVIRGYATLPRERRETLEIDALEAAADRIHETVERVGSFAPELGSATRPVDLSEAVAAAADESVVTKDLEDATFVPGDDGVAIMMRELLDTLVAHRSGTEPITIAVERAEQEARVRVRAPGVDLSDAELDRLRSDSLPEFDDPKTGFGLQIVRLFADRYDAEIAVDRSPTAITVAFPRTGATGSAARIAPDEALAAGGVAIVAGIGMGVYLHAAAGLMPVIGALYAVPNALVGWVTHLFHSVVFGLLFAAGVTLPRGRSVVGPAPHAVVGIGWGVALWLIAAGLVMPLWLGLVGIDVAVPNLSVAGLVGHVLWGAILGAGYWLVRR